MAALGLTLIASVRRRRHELALFKTIGFTRRQLSTSIAWQSTVAVAIGTVIGVPAGVIVGRWLWDLFARAIDVVPQPTVSLLAITLIAISAHALANVVAAIPARHAALAPRCSSTPKRDPATDTSAIGSWRSSGFGSDALAVGRCLLGADPLSSLMS
jgi:predicted lysophospholipase L1 biosynthesis ABC-type transport system permease subunit